MTDDKTPEQKIQALFFQALLPADKNLKPSDIQIEVKPHAQATTDSFFKDCRSIKIDLGKTPFKEHVAAICFGLMSFGGLWRSDPFKGTIEYQGEGLMEKATVPQIQTAIASSMIVPRNIAEPLAACIKSKSRA